MAPGRPFVFEDSSRFTRVTVGPAFLDGPCACGCNGTDSRAAFLGPDVLGRRREAADASSSSRLGRVFAGRDTGTASSRTLAVCTGRTPSSFASTGALDVLPVFFLRSAPMAPVARLVPTPTFEVPVTVEPGRVRT